MSISSGWLARSGNRDSVANLRSQCDGQEQPEPPLVLINSTGSTSSGSDVRYGTLGTRSEMVTAPATPSTLTLPQCYQDEAVVKRISHQLGPMLKA
jgi:hypothetical protein